MSDTAPATVSAVRQRTRVFISYARVDHAFADCLAAALTARGLEVLIDRQSLPALEDWQRELLVLIRKADTVVFIVSPRSVASPVCRWEVEQMAALDKRLAPVVLERVDNDRLPAAITRINYLFFDPPNGFDAQADALARALETDIAWWHEHTRLVDLAGRWNRDGRTEGLLLRSGAITAAQSWASRRPDKAQIPDVVFQLLDASLKKEELDREELNKREQRISTEVQRLVAGEARRAGEAGLHAMAMRLAIAGEPSAEERARGVAPEPTRRVQLARSAHATPFLGRLSGHDGAVLLAVYCPNGSRIVTASFDGTARLWDATSGAELVCLRHGSVVWCAAFCSNGDRIVTASSDKTARLWEVTSGTELARLDHDGTVYSAAFSPDERRVVTASYDKTARLWDVSRGEELARLHHADGVNSAAFSPDGSQIVTTSCDNTARLWDAITGAELFRLSHDAAVLNATFNADSSRAVTASQDRTARLWDTTSGTELARLDHGGDVQSVSFSRDGNHVVTASADTTARLWDAKRGAELARLGHDRAVTSATFNTDGSCVLTASADGTARLWDFSGAEIARFDHGSDGPIARAEFSPDAAHVVTASHDETAGLWDIACGSTLANLKHDNEVTDAAFASNGNNLVTASRRTVRLWEYRPLAWVGTPWREMVRLELDSKVECARFSPDGSRLIIASGNTARLWDAASCEELGVLRHDREVRNASFSLNGLFVVTSSADYTARIWEVATRSELARLEHDGVVFSAEFSPDSRRIVTASGFVNAARVWDVANGTELVRLRHDKTINSATFSPNGRQLVTASDDKTARLWDAELGTELARFGHDDKVSNAIFSPDGGRIVTASADDAAWLWDVRTGAELACLRHDGTVVGGIYSISFSPDGTRIVTASADETARLWDSASGLELARFTHGNAVISAAFSPDGSRVVTTSWDNTARLWDATWICHLQGDALVRAVVRHRLVGEGRLTEEDRRLLRPLLGEVDPDVSSRWIAPSPDDAAIDDAITQWRRHREMALTLARQDWAARAAAINAGLVNARAAPPSPGSQVQPPADAMPARAPVTQADLAGQTFVETHCGVHIFRLADGRHHVVSHFAVATLDDARAAAEQTARGND